MEHIYFGKPVPLNSLCSVTVNVPPPENAHDTSLYQPTVIRCRELIFTEPDIIATPSPQADGTFLIIMTQTLFKTGKLQKRFQRMGIQPEKPRRVLPHEFQAALQYTMLAKLAPQWNKAGEYLVQGRDFVTSGQNLNAVSCQITVSENELYVTLLATRIRMPLLKLADLGICLSTVREFFDDRPHGVIQEYSILNKWCQVLPSLKKGQIVGVSHQLPRDTTFQSYKELKRHWKNTYGYRLPETDEGMLYYQVYFKLIGNTLFTYPGYCLRPQGLIALPRVDPRPIINQFLSDLHARLPSICGQQAKFCAASPQFPKAELIDADELRPQANLTDRCPQRHNVGFRQNTACRTTQISASNNSSPKPPINSTSSQQLGQSMSQLNRSAALHPPISDSSGRLNQPSQVAGEREHHVKHHPVPSSEQSLQGRVNQFNTISKHLEQKTANHPSHVSSRQYGRRLDSNPECIKQWSNQAVTPTSSAYPSTQVRISDVEPPLSQTIIPPTQPSSQKRLVPVFKSQIRRPVFKAEKSQPSLAPKVVPKFAARVNHDRTASQRPKPSHQNQIPLQQDSSTVPGVSIPSSGSELAPKQRSFPRFFAKQPAKSPSLKPSASSNKVPQNRSTLKRTPISSGQPGNKGIHNSKLDGGVSGNRGLGENGAYSSYMHPPSTPGKSMAVRPKPTTPSQRHGTITATSEFMMPRTPSMCGSPANSQSSASSSMLGTPAKRKNQMSDDGKSKKPRAKPKIQSGVDVAAYVRNDQLGKLNAPTLAAWLKERGIVCKSKDKKVDLIARVYQALHAAQSES